MTTRRREAGEGGISSYETKAGTRHLITFYDGNKRVLRRGFSSRKDVAIELGRLLQEVRRGTYVAPDKQPTGDYLDDWLAGARIKPSTRANYAKNLRLHIKPHIGDVPLSKLTTSALNKMYRALETEGRVSTYERGGQTITTGAQTAGLSPRTVRYCHQIVHRALLAAVNEGRLAVNPADKANPPSSKQAASPEMACWTGEQLATFLGWARENSPYYASFYALSWTGMRRGELLALRWRDIDLDACRVSVRRSVGVVKAKGQPLQIVEGGTKTDKPRQVDLDGLTVEVLRAWRRERGGMALQLARDDALVFGDLEGQHRNPESFSRSFRDELARCRRQLGESAPPVIRVHDLRHTHATLLLMAGEPVKVVSERLGHVTTTITTQIYQHVLPGMQRAAVDRLAASIFGGGGA